MPLEPHQGAEHRGEMARALLERPGALVTALAPDGFRIPLPSSLKVASENRLPVPVPRATMIDLVVPDDGLTVVGAWEQVNAMGFAQCAVRLRHDALVSVTLTFVDVTDLHGAIIGVISDRSIIVGTPAIAPVAAALAIPLRPRTASIDKNSFGVVTGIDQRAEHMLGWTPAQMIGNRSTDFIHPDDCDRAVSIWLEMLAKEQSVRVRLRHHCADGSWLWVECENIYLPGDEGGEVTVVTELTDISDEMSVHEELDRRERLLRRLTESVPVGLLQVGVDRSLVYANERFAAMVGIAAATSLDDLRCAVVDEDRPRLDTALAAALSATARESELELRLGSRRQSQQGPTPLRGGRICALSIVPLSDREGAPGALLSLMDVTDSARMREELLHKATFDDLTSCRNRASIMSHLDEVLRKPNSRMAAAIFVDLDRFKQINDTRGHDAGDEVLIQTASRLRGVLRRGDLVGRIGGDEFLVVGCDLDTAEDALRIADRIRSVLAQPVTLTRDANDVDGIVEFGASIGVATSEPGIDGAALTRRADQAMYASKQAGDGVPVLFRKR